MNAVNDMNHQYQQHSRCSDDDDDASQNGQTDRQWQQWGCNFAAWPSDWRYFQAKSFLDNIITITNTSLACLSTTIYINRSMAIISHDTQTTWVVRVTPQVVW